MFQNGFSIFKFVPGLAHTFTIIANVRRTHHSPLPSSLARQNSQHYKEHTKCAYANVKSLHSLRYGKASHGNGNDREPFKLYAGDAFAICYKHAQASGTVTYSNREFNRN